MCFYSWEFGVLVVGVEGGVLNPSALARFATSCGAFAPLEIAIEYHDGTVAASGVLTQPFAVVGRDAACDIALTSEEIEPQAAFLQVIGGQVFVADLGSKAGLRWFHGRHPFGWMYAGEPIAVGPFVLRLLQHVSPHPAPFGATFHPMVAGPDVPAGLPPVEVLFKTGLADRTRWPVNRVLTMIGSAPECKIHLTGEGVAARHGYLLHTHDGLWVVDLSGLGVEVNGQRTRFTRLAEADELTVGPFVLSFTYPNPIEEDGRISFDDVPRPTPRNTEHDTSTQSGHRPVGLSPSNGSHRATIKTDFDLDLAAPVSATPEPAHWQQQEKTDPLHRPLSLRPADSGEIVDVVDDSNAPLALTPLPPDPAAVVPALQKLGALHERMLAQFHDTVTRLLPAFEALPSDRKASVQAVLMRLTDVTAELAARQAELLQNLDDAPLALDRLTQLDDDRRALADRLAELTTIP